MPSKILLVAVDSGCCWAERLTGIVGDYATAIMDLTRLATAGSRSALCGLRSAS
jgi:hypothetical protein